MLINCIKNFPLNYNLNFTSKFHPKTEKTSLVSYSQLNHFSHFFRNDRSDYIISYLDQKPNSKKERCNIISLGCSYGQEVYSYAVKLSEAGFKDNIHILGCDLSEQAIDYAKDGIYDENDDLSCIEDLAEYKYPKYFELQQNEDVKVKKELLPECDFVVEDVRNIKVKDESQDVVLFNNVLYHLVYDMPEKETKKVCDKMAQKISNMLKPKGLLLTDTCVSRRLAIRAPEMGQAFHDSLTDKNLIMIENGIYRKMPKNYRQKINETEKFLACYNKLF